MYWAETDLLFIILFRLIKYLFCFQKFPSIFEPNCVRKFMDICTWKAFSFY